MVLVAVLTTKPPHNYVDDVNSTMSAVSTMPIQLCRLGRLEYVDSTMSTRLCRLDYVDYVVAVQIPGVSEERLFAFIVVALTELELRFEVALRV